MNLNVLFRSFEICEMLKPVTFIKFDNYTFRSTSIVAQQTDNCYDVALMRGATREKRKNVELRMYLNTSPLALQNLKNYLLSD